MKLLTIRCAVTLLGLMIAAFLLAACTPDIECSGGEAKRLLSEKVLNQQKNNFALSKWYDWSNATVEVTDASQQARNATMTHCSAQVEIGHLKANKPGMKDSLHFDVKYFVFATRDDQVYLNIVDLR